MVFLTLLFITLKLFILFRGYPYASNFVEAEELRMKSIKEGQLKSGRVFGEEYGKLILAPSLIMLSMTIFNIIYLVKAISVDIYLYPTLIMIAWTIIALIKNKTKSSNSDLESEEARYIYKQNLNKMLYDRKFNHFCWLIYYLYMFWILVF